MLLNRTIQNINKYFFNYLLLLYIDKLFTIYQYFIKVWSARLPEVVIFA